MPVPSNTERFLASVSAFEVKPEVLDEIRSGLRDARGLRWAGQELLKRTALAPGQIAQALREAGLDPTGSDDELDGGEARVAEETVERPRTWQTEEVEPGEVERRATASERRRAEHARPPAQDSAVDPAALTRELPASGRLSKEETRELAIQRRRGLGLAPGVVLGGRFRLDEEVGRGAQGIVYRARDLALARDVAVKLLRTDAPGQARERFQREAKTISRLRHPGIVTVYETGSTENGNLYYAMELVSGRSLEDLLDEEGYLEPERLVAILEAVSLAIHHAHDAGLIHRDLKPGNLLLDADEERPRIADFGLVSLGDATRLTMTRGVVGTPVYMAPEQAEGARVDRRADVYSLGAILYEGLVGKPPFGGVTPLEIFRRIVEEDPIAPRVIRPEVPKLVERVCLRALEKDPRARYPTAAAFGRDLRRALDGQRLAPEAPAPFVRRRLRRRRRLIPVAGGVTLGALLGVAVGWALAPRDAPARPSHAAPLAALPDPGRATARGRILEVARQERARCLPRTALAWLDTLSGDGEHDPLAPRDAGRGRALAALCWLDLEDQASAQRFAQDANRLAGQDPLVQVAVAAASGPAGLAGVEALLREEPGSIEALLEKARLTPNLTTRLQCLDYVVGLTEPRPWPLALRRRAALLLEQGRLEDATLDVARLLERVGMRQGFEAERALALWSEDPVRASRLLKGLLQPDRPKAFAALALKALPRLFASAEAEGVQAGWTYRVQERTRTKRRLVLSAPDRVTEQQEEETVVARYTDHVLEVDGQAVVRLERTYEQLLLTTGEPVSATELRLIFGPEGLELAPPPGLDPRLLAILEREAASFVRWHSGGAPALPRPLEGEGWDLPLGRVAAMFGVTPGDLAAGSPLARGRLVERGADGVTVELVGALKLGRYGGLPCAQPGQGIVRNTLTYSDGQARPSHEVLEGSYSGEAGISWANLGLAFEVTVEGERTTLLE